MNGGYLMANIMLNNTCNLSCSYCFANNFKEHPEHISFNNFKKAIDFCLTSRKGAHIGIIGGEPTLHPLFADFLNYLKDMRKVQDVVIFTNGILLEKYLHCIDHPKFSVLINCNSSETIGKENYEKLKETIRKISCIDSLKNRVSLGLNIYDSHMDFDFIFELLKIGKMVNLRLSIAAPNQSIGENFNTLEFYNQFKPTVLKIIFEALNHEISPFFDCNQLPICLISDSERKKILELQEKRGRVTNIISTAFTCTPIIDISPNLDAIRCFGMAQLGSVSITKFSNISDLIHFFETAMDDYKYILPTTTKCSRCIYSHIKKCQGGCLCYKISKIKKAKKRLISL